MRLLDEWSWAVGFFEGEGTITASKNRGWNKDRYYITVGVHQNQIEPLERFQKVVGIGRLYGPYAARGISTNPYYRWTAQVESEVIALLQEMYEHLSVRRREQIDRALALTGRVI